MNLSKSDTLAIKGLAIVFVMVGHFINAGFFHMNVLRFSGAWGVAMFLFVSGYGLYKSYQNNKTMNHYIQNKIDKVFLPYFIVTIIWILTLNNKLFVINDLKIVILSLIGLDLNRTIDGTMWYISFLFINYLIFYLVFKLSIKCGIKILILLLVCYMIGKFPILNYESVNYQFHLHWASFPLGVVVSYFEDKKTVNLKKYIKVFLIFIFLSFSVILFKYVEVSLPCYSLFSVSIAAIFILLCTIVSEKIKILYQIIGKYSYELYLVEGMVIFNIGIIDKSGILAFPIIILLAFMLKKILNMIE